MNVERKIVNFTLVYIVGIIVGFNNLYLACTLIFCGICLSLGMVKIHKNYLKVIFILLPLILGIVIVNLHNIVDESLAPWEGENVEVTGKIKPKILSNNRYIIELEKINKTKLKNKPLVLIQFKKDCPEYFSWNDKVKLKGKLNGLKVATNPGQFSEKDYWSKQKVYQKIYVLEKGEVLKQGTGFFAYTFKFREKVAKKIVDLFPEKQSGIILGIILGDKSNLDEHYYDLFQKLGIVHIFAVSGLHVGYILGAYLLLSKVCKISPTFNLFFAIILLFFYSLITGLSPSVIRASLMSILVLLGTNLLKYKDFYTIIASSALVILIFNPLALFTISFQLSFITVWGLVYFSQITREIFVRFPSKIREILSISLAAQIASLPIVVYYFNLISFVAPLVNVLIVGIVSVLVPLLLATILISFGSTLVVSPLIFFCNVLLDGIMLFSDLIMKIFSSGYTFFPSPPLIGIILYYFILILIRERKTIYPYIPKKIRIITSIILVVILLLLTIPINQEIRMTFLDVGQGDSCVIQTNQNKKIVIDGGPDTTTLFNYLKHIGTNKVDLVVLSHPDSDHINGLFKVLESIKVSTLLVPPDAYNNEALQELKNIAKKKETKIIEGKQGMKLTVGGQIILKIIAPHPNNLSALDVNNASIVFIFTYGKQDILFTGDVENKGIEKFVNQLDEVEVIKVPHHGSKSSDSAELYDNTNPSMAIISAGRSNQYNHPHQDIVKKLKKRKIETFRTDKNGAIILKVKKDRLKPTTTLVN
ncbi:competence protein ComEC [Desulfonispora thiosulfatigenes DSM 11270]|uniref:Competence protein ComEC n=1 Tax=Desulfonispora thiosulfatigenes DSM 11270 TaxID=656914 RepID=A0A1W1VBN8_DESTI|nr:DNA internalization-related competence protein ComEC/Rec2 [Desulfonispora thiosulfatigenes]SMB90819.1 competence protein ComEC [Desulfonispora thiosulfatigenes DSM 11270]